MLYFHTKIIILPAIFYNTCAYLYFTSAKFSEFSKFLRYLSISSRDSSATYVHKKNYLNVSFTFVPFSNLGISFFIFFFLTASFVSSQSVQFSRFIATWDDVCRAVSSGLHLSVRPSSVLSPLNIAPNIFRFSPPTLLFFVPVYIQRDLAMFSFLILEDSKASVKAVVLILTRKGDANAGAIWKG